MYTFSTYLIELKYMYMYACVQNDALQQLKWHSILLIHSALVVEQGSDCFLGTTIK